jgi:hypothetical protein
MYEGEIISLTQSQKHYSLKDNDLKWIATWWFYEIVMPFFMEHTMEYFVGVFVNIQGNGLEKYKQILESKFLA